MDIKDIALKVANSLRNRMDGISRVQSNQGLIRFAEALIESYIADLLKGVGKPVLYAEFAEDGGWLGAASECADYLEEPHALFTSYQVAAAIIKATEPLEERRCEICGYAEHHREHTGCLRTKLAAAQEEIANETAEACAKACEDVIGNTPHDQRMLAAIDCAVMLRSGAWKGFKK